MLPDVSVVEDEDAQTGLEGIDTFCRFQSVLIRFCRHSTACARGDSISYSSTLQPNHLDPFETWLRRPLANAFYPLAIQSDGERRSPKTGQ